jgi:hypothetical protein
VTLQYINKALTQTTDLNVYEWRIR